MKNNQSNFTRHQLSLAVMFASSLALVACGGGGGGSADSSQTQTSANTNASGNTNSNQNNNANNSSSSTSTTELEFNAGIAKDFVDELAVPAYKNFATQSASLPTTIQSYCDALGKSNEASTITAAQNAWNSLKNDWQALQVYAVGPVATDNASLANEMTKLEKALYTAETDATKKSNNCTAAVTAANAVKTRADASVTAWKDGRNTFLTNKEANGVDLIQPFFDNVANLVDVKIKSEKVAVPAGLKSSSACTTVTCPELVENSVSKTSYESIKANLQGLKAIFNGSTDGKGFKAFYAKKEMASQAQTFEKQIDDAIATIDEQSTSLYQQLDNIKANNKANECTTVKETGITKDADLTPCKLYYQVKKISDDIKVGTFKAAVNLSLPSAAAGDGD